ncbi:MAG TPA: DUF192 domain-containing protein [Actinomycetota bacterium]
MRVLDPSTRQVLVVADEAKGFAGRSVGLLGAPGLPPGRGLLIRTCQVHTIGMQFTIDAVYLSKGGRVVRVRTLRPGRLGPLVPSARWVLELAEGEAARLHLTPGTPLLLDA